MYGGPLSRSTTAALRRFSPGLRSHFGAWFAPGSCLLGVPAPDLHPCATNVQCSPLGDRFCDVSSPDGYCTIEGCDSSTCPDSNGVCIRFFSLKVNGGHCATRAEPALTSIRITRALPLDCDNPSTGCEAALRHAARSGSTACARSPTAASRLLRQREHGAPLVHAHMQQDSDCRTGYQCLTTGYNGALAWPFPTWVTRADA